MSRPGQSRVQDALFAVACLQVPEDRGALNFCTFPDGILTQTRLGDTRLCKTGEKDIRFRTGLIQNVLARGYKPGITP
jgi:hypothetical protein